MHKVLFHDPNILQLSASSQCHVANQLLPLVCQCVKRLADMSFAIQYVGSVVGADHADSPYLSDDSSFHDGFAGSARIKDRPLKVLGCFLASLTDPE